MPVMYFPPEWLSHMRMHEMAAAQATPGYSCPYVVSEPTRWINVPGDTDLLPTAVLSQFCCCITARWSINGWEALCSQTASPRGHQLQTQWRNWGALWLVWASLQGKKWNLNPTLFFFSKLWHEQRGFSPDELSFFLCNSNQNKKNST